PDKEIAVSDGFHPPSAPAWLCRRIFISALRRGTGIRRSSRGLTSWIGEETEKLRVWVQQEARIIALQAGLVGCHRAIEREEIGILAVGLCKQAVTFRVALTADLFRL